MDNFFLVEKKIGRSRQLVLLTTLFCVIVTGILVALPVAFERHVKARLSSTSEYTGQVSAVSSSLLTASYTLHDIEISKLTGDVPVPFFSADRVHISIGWETFPSLKPVSTIEFHRAQINFVDSNRQEGRQFGTQTDWVALINELSPVPVERVKVSNGELRFRNFDLENPLDVSIHDVSAWAINLAGGTENEGTFQSSMVFQGRIFNNGGLWLMTRFDPLLRSPDFRTKLRVDSVELERAEALTNVYAPFDIEGGELNLVAEFLSSDGDLEGYIKPQVHDLEIFRWRKDVLDDEDNVFQLVWESFADLTTELFENQRDNQFATLIPVTGSLVDIELNYVSTVANVLRNAFLEAYDQQFELNDDTRLLWTDHMSDDSKGSGFFDLSVADDRSQE